MLSVLDNGIHVVKVHLFSWSLQHLFYFVDCRELAYGLDRLVPEIGSLCCDQLCEALWDFAGVLTGNKTYLECDRHR